MAEENPKKVSVNSVHDEYEHVASQRCECGGTYHVEEQTLIQLAGTDKHWDSLRCRCMECGAERNFGFDVTKLFRRHDQIDAKPNTHTAPEQEADHTD